MINIVASFGSCSIELLGRFLHSFYSLSLSLSCYLYNNHIRWSFAEVSQCFCIHVNILLYTNVPMYNGMQNASIRLFFFLHWQTKYFQYTSSPFSIWNLHFWPRVTNKKSFSLPHIIVGEPWQMIQVHNSKYKLSSICRNFYFTNRSSECASIGAMLRLVLVIFTICLP